MLCNNIVRYYSGLIVNVYCDSFDLLLSDVAEAVANTTVYPAHIMSLHPYFNFDVSRNVTARVGQTTFLQCKVEQLGDKSVSLSFCVFCSLSRHTTFLPIRTCLRFFFSFFVELWWFSDLLFAIRPLSTNPNKVLMIAPNSDEVWNNRHLHDDESFLLHRAKQSFALFSTIFLWLRPSSRIHRCKFENMFTECEILIS